MIVFRIPTKAQYSYIEITGEYGDMMSFQKEELIKLLEKHNNACKLAQTVDQSEEEKFTDSLEETK